MSRRAAPEEHDDDNSGPLFADPPRPTRLSAFLKPREAEEVRAGGKAIRDALSVEPRGETYDPALDRDRLGRQSLRVQSLMADGAWRTLAEISTLTGDPEASVSARLRDLRRAGWTVDRRRVGDPKAGLWQYRASRENPECG